MLNIKMESKKSNKCLMKVNLKKETGDFEWEPFKGYEKRCETTIKTLNPIRGIFWKKRKKVNIKNAK